MILNLQDICMRYEVYGGCLHVLDRISLNLYKGQSVGLVGESGCGKTTILKALMGILPSNAKITSGAAYYCGQDIFSMQKEELQKYRRNGAGMIFQDPTSALNPVFSIEDQLTAALKYSSTEQLNKGALRNRAIKALQDVSLPDPERILEQYPFQLSGGMRQRVCIAMALAARKQILLADEPGTSLDVTIQDQILHLINELVHEKGLSVLMVSHSLGVIREVTTFVYVMYAGTIVERGYTRDVFNNPKHPYTIALMECLPKLTGEGISRGIPGRIPNYLHPPSGCRFAPRCPYATDICNQERPELESVEQDHAVACFHSELVSSTERASVEFYAPAIRSSDKPTNLEQKSETLLEIQNIKKYFPFKRKLKVKAVDGIDLHIKRAETLGLVGESGSGKSTVAYMVAGMYKPTEGSIYFNNTLLVPESKKRSRQEQSEIQLVFQDPGGSFNPRRTIKQSFELTMRSHRKLPRREWTEAIGNLLEMVGLPAEYMNKLPRSLGGGERQLASIARAMAANPSLMILDEPTSALDVSMQANVINKLLDLQNEMLLSYLFITHDLSLMRNVANRVAIMYLGRICEIAYTEDFFRSPQHPYTRMLLSAIPVATDEEDALKLDKIIPKGEIPSPVHVPPGCSFHLRCPERMDICSQMIPQMKQSKEGHSVACHLFG